MAYLDIVFHNIRRNMVIVGAGQAYYNGFPAAANVGQGAGGAFVVPGPSAAWGASVTGAATAAGIFLCEAPAYGSFFANWDVPPLNILGNLGMVPATDRRCLYLRGGAPAGPVAVLPAVPMQIGAAAWFGRGLLGAPDHGIRCLGTGAVNFPPLPVPSAPPGSDRFALLFQADWNYNGSAQRVTGLFVHTKNTQADPGTQIVALCRLFPNEIIFGDMNLNLREVYKNTSLSYAVGGTHTILALRQVGGGGNYYHTRYAGGGGTSTIDYALVPNAQVANVELWARCPGPVPVLQQNGSDHSVMMLRIRV
ncbi:endonuclease/exonuclease/phosphatase family protein [Desulfoluna spongiiphila]|uniref:endonuclease/exonuclease/phosphatase family protein n=1 Tax=Desulfoluna spongiiphila TaxID=419481 RepID=UPI00125C7ADD|nr:endonuclease/exonuclease/phosphatase family protein [Desulfoluna spongiiphila]VVS95097.1 endonuclease/exonuclease/phosphatase superfamily [Desulfoluna spongiiphila]